MHACSQGCHSHDICVTGVCVCVCFAGVSIAYSILEMVVVNRGG